MKLKTLSSSLAVLLIAGHAVAADSKKEARVTQIIRDVKIMPADAAAREAVVNDKVAANTGVRTGGDSRSELTFVDLTITRLGANTIFSFDNAGRTAQVDSGSILFCVPKNSGGGRIKTNAVTVAVTGTTVIMDSTRGGRNKLTVLEGSARVSLVKYPKQFQNVRAGQMVDVPPGATTVPLPTNVDLNQIMNTNPLITDFPPLPSRNLIVATNQQPPPPGPPPSGPSTFPILPVIDLLGGGFNHHHPPNRTTTTTTTTKPGTTTTNPLGTGGGYNTTTPPPTTVVTRRGGGRTHVPGTTTTKTTGTTTTKTTGTTTTKTTTNQNVPKSTTTTTTKKRLPKKPDQSGPIVR